MPANDNAQHIRADVVGSLLRPPELVEAREKFEQGRISLGALDLIEDRFIIEAITMQERAGLDVITDGEFRRSSFAGQFPGAVAGVADTSASVCISTKRAAFQSLLQKLR